MAESFDELKKSIDNTEVVDVWCLGCESWTIMNAKYAKYLQGEIESCSKCRES